MDDISIIHRAAAVGLAVNPDPNRGQAQAIRDWPMGQDWSSLQARDMCWRFLRRLSDCIATWTADDAADAHDLAGFDDVMGMARLFCDTYDATAPSWRRR